ncbi:hypothetical protein PVK06_011269 [Gossypium arboreum]|uniref:Uncharacterized protein n=1 Tax=Gossypium arboreum TaxID=29729 RepID=A0ABR0Q946_GOSAR|nr:hypothetical protein PVK06_011269 [Gossypium arboreum]
MSKNYPRIPGVWNFFKEESGSNSEGPDDVGGTHLDFTPYEPSLHMYNVNLHAKYGLEFLELPHRRPKHASSLLNVDDLQVGMEFSLKDDFVAIVMRYNIKHGVNFHVTKSQSEKFEVK